MQPAKREIECFLNEEALKDLIIEYLHKVTIVKSTEEVTHLTVGPAIDGTHRLYIRFEPDIKVI